MSIRDTSRSPWTATGAGPRRAACRPSPGTSRGWRRSARSSASRPTGDRGPLPVCLQPRELASARRRGRRPARPDRRRRPPVHRRARRRGIRVRVIGRLHEAPADIVRSIREAEDRTRGGEKMALNIAFNYAGRAEIIDAAQRLVRRRARLHDIDEERFGDELYTAGQPDPDLIIRTGGEQRTSNFRLAAPMPSSSSPRPCGRTSSRPIWKPRSRSSPNASAATAHDGPMLATRLISAGILAPIVVAVALLGAPDLVAGRPARLPRHGRADLGVARRGRVLPPRASPWLRESSAGAWTGGSQPGPVGGALADLLRATDPPGLRRWPRQRGRAVGAAGFTRAAARRVITWAVTSFGIAYVGLLAPFIVVVAHRRSPAGRPPPHRRLDLHAGTAWMLMLLLVVWGYDFGAYLTSTLAGTSSADRPHQPIQDRRGARWRPPRQRPSPPGLGLADRARPVAAARDRPVIGLAAQAGTWPSRWSSVRPAARSRGSWSLGTAAFWIGSTRSSSRPRSRSSTRCWSPASACDRRRSPRLDRIDRAAGGRGDRAHRDRFSLVGLGSGRATDEFAAQMAAWPAARAWCADGRPRDLPRERWAPAFYELATLEGAEIVVVATTGMTALPAVLAALASRRWRSPTRRRWSPAATSWRRSWRRSRATRSTA